MASKDPNREQPPPLSIEIKATGDQFFVNFFCKLIHSLMSSDQPPETSLLDSNQEQQPLSGVVEDKDDDLVLELGHCKDCERYQNKSFELNIVVSHACLAVVSLLCVSHNLRKHGIRKFLFVDQLSGRMGPLKAQYIQQISNSVRLLALWSLPCFGLKAVREIIRMLYVPHDQPWLSVLILLSMILSWTYLSTIFLAASAMFHLVCNLQVIHFEDYAKLLDGESEISLFIYEHICLRHYLSKISHRFRIFLLLQFLVVTISQFTTLFQQTYHVSAVVQVVGIILCLHTATKISHRAQAIASVASKWHVIMSCSSTDTTQIRTSPSGAVQLDPEFSKNVGQIVLFGGAFAVNGNVNPASEANIFGDPEAADIVFTCGADVIAVGINVTHQVIMTGQSRFQFNKSMVDSQPIREEEDATQTASTLHHQMIPSELTQDEFAELTDSITEFHTYQLGPGRCSSLLAQRIKSPPETVWSVVRRFDRPQTYKHFIKSCSVDEGFEMRVGCTRYVDVISGLPANTSRERLDLLDDDRRVTGFSITGGEHRLRNYKSVTTVHGFERDGRISSVVLESYVVDVPEGNTEEDTRLFADTVVKLNLQKLASVAEGMDPNSGDGRNSPVM
ncbi:hypothetical protein F2Q70_00002140 [Brassica cretica]|uniref:Inosine/uridine-preferring nucleoside hydrolase domain-containing protein n=2 Tax=Brassica cretica TaxID=69181 RepID=A0A8S9J2Q3_BRACR|nr:hypothetical protein F2Q70_00002140 [Brassica cretica]